MIMKNFISSSFYSRLLFILFFARFVFADYSEPEVVTHPVRNGAGAVDRRSDDDVDLSSARVPAGYAAFISARGPSSVGNYYQNGYGPHRNKIKPGILMKKLGADYDPTWMSADMPSRDEVRNVSVKISMDMKLYHDLTRLNFTYRDDNGMEKSLRSSVRKYLEKWLMQRSACPVHLIWEDVGALFWPRWIRRGICDDAGASCSWPPGMHCVPEESQTIRLLRWQCGSTTASGRHLKPKQRIKWNNRKREPGYGRGKEKIRCRWKKVPYPVTTECFCSC